MTVDELIEALQEISDNDCGDCMIIIQKDAEGNNYSPLSSIDEDGYVAETKWSGYTDPSSDVHVIVLVPRN